MALPFRALCLLLACTAALGEVQLDGDTVYPVGNPFAPANAFFTPSDNCTDATTPMQGVAGDPCTDACFANCPKVDLEGGSSKTIGCCINNRCASAEECNAIFAISMMVLGIPVWGFLVFMCCICICLATACTTMVMCCCKARAAKKRAMELLSESDEDSESPRH